MHRAFVLCCTVVWWNMLCKTVLPKTLHTAVLRCKECRTFSMRRAHKKVPTLKTGTFRQAEGSRPYE